MVFDLVKEYELVCVGWGLDWLNVLIVIFELFMLMGGFNFL